MLENQTPQLFQDVNKPKYNGTLNLDRWALSPSIEFAHACNVCWFCWARGSGEGKLCHLWPSDCPGEVMG